MSWRYGKTRCPLRLVVIFKNYFPVWLNFTAESVNCSFFFEKSRKNIFAIRLTKKKDFVQHIETLPQHLSEKFIGDNLSISPEEIEIYRLSVSLRAFLQLSIIVIALAQKGVSCPSLPEIGYYEYTCLL